MPKTILYKGQEYKRIKDSSPKTITYKDEKYIKVGDDVNALNDKDALQAEKIRSDYDNLVSKIKTWSNTINSNMYTPQITIKKVTFFYQLASEILHEMFFMTLHGKPKIKSIINKINILVNMLPEIKVEKGSEQFGKSLKGILNNLNTLYNK